ncbi:disulfide bond formation protein DsbB [Neiella marina]|uniref:Disulfide bond formation protein B n=1 Tax=Neiella holothuriorum TaxID=2870530 RepID=A0ABS7ED10_9GAMM|nr:disulfide bond formation protein DsbB [Neiella holothuriorum]MBW8190236.1 disulfide bond formation protein DsbB [Neiella holothuriorum]
MRALCQFAETRWSWLLLAISALVLDLVALYFQHVMLLEPCVKCIHERVAMFGLMFAGLIGLINPRSMVVRIAGYGLWIYSAIEGLRIALSHVALQAPTANPFINSCGMDPEFPSWAPLDYWLPEVFMPRGMCDEVQWEFLGYSMPQWLVVCFSVYIAIWTVVLMSRFWIARRP